MDSPLPVSCMSNSPLTLYIYNFILICNIQALNHKDSIVFHVIILYLIFKIVFNSTFSYCICQLLTLLIFFHLFFRCVAIHLFRISYIPTCVKTDGAGSSSLYVGYRYMFCFIHCYVTTLSHRHMRK